MTPTSSPVQRGLPVLAEWEIGPATIVQLLARELGNCSYVVADTASRVAAVIDAVRDVDCYLDLAQQRGWTPVATLDTHIHNDYLSGGPALRADGLTAVAPEGMAHADRLADEAAPVKLGSLRLRPLATPGHTPEHVSYLLTGAAGEPLALFSGGALMVGTVARPDLLGPSRTYELVAAARISLQRLLDLPAALPVLPTHGGGSFCGTASSSLRTTTIAAERETNPLALAPDAAHFLAHHAAQGEYPAYYRRMAPLNRTGASAAPGDVLTHLGPERGRALAAESGQVVDCRGADAHAAGHIPGSLSIGIGGAFGPWAGWVCDPDLPTLLVCSDAAMADEARRQLQRIGHDRLVGWVDPESWSRTGEPLETIDRIRMAELAPMLIGGERITVIDTRLEREWSAGHLPGAVHLRPDQIEAALPGLDGLHPIAVYCASGYRSSLAASILRRAGLRAVFHLTESVDDWAALGHPLTLPA